MVGSAIVADDTCAVDTEHYVQVLERHVMDDIIVRPLQEGGVNVAIRNHPCFRQTCAESDRVSFGYTDIEDAIW